MKRYHSLMAMILMLIGSTFLTIPPGWAWEFEMGGSFNWTHEWYSQRGARGFLGAYNVDNGAGTRVANLNFWNGGQFDTNLTTSAQAKWSYFNVEFEPTIKINPAIQISGKYRLGTYGDPATTPRIRQGRGTRSAKASGHCFG